MTWLEYDQGLIDEIASRMDLRAPNKAALTKIIENIHVDEFQEVVCDLATGVGKTYLAAALVEYLACQGLRNVLVVTPGKTIQDKTIANFTPGSPKYVPGADYQPLLITAENFSRGQVGDALHDPDRLKLFVFNVQQLIRPGANTSRRVREMDEFVGGALYSHLQSANDLVVIADEHHVYRAQARAFSSAIRDLKPRAMIGLTATPDDADQSKVIYRYSLAEAIADGLVKVPVIVYRQDGHKDIATQLADACHLRTVKAAAYQTWADATGERVVNPVLFVVCQTVEDAQDTANLLANDSYIGDPAAVLEITSQSSDAALAALAAVEDPDSPIRAVVSVDKLKEGWDVKNIGVIVALRRLASQALTEQILGRGLRLPYGRRVGVPMIDTVDLVAHDSYRKLLEQKDALIERIVPIGESAESGEPTEPGIERSAQERAAAQVEEVGSQGELRLITPARIINGERVDGTAGLILQEYSVAESEGQRDASEYRILQRVEGAPQIKFPRREREVLPVRFSLSLVDDADARASGAAFAHEITIPLIREALTARRTRDGDVEVRREALDPGEAHQEWIPLERVVTDLESRILGLGLVEESLAEYNAVRRVVRAFLRGAGAIDGTEVNWGAARAHLALEGIDALIRQKYNMRRLQPQYVFNPVTLPVEPRPMPTDILDRYDEFERGRWYSGWRKSVLPVASFDAKTTERRLAEILDSSSRIQWWLRLQPNDPAYIELDTGGRYFPDFIAVDDVEVHWLIEGKSDHDVPRRDVEAKRAAAEEWARFVNDDGRFGTWRYLFCSESALKNSHGGWDTLLVAAGAAQQ
ncbi:DEAD/DEAH box helicase family protein [Nocardia cyriacigeorgica]|uniref:DEAD/DEAH box helicase family protein n=1 Tax=Nocardia cyriacigeorgica TaxID=135487 RepID=A0A6P1CMQ7_9NOCA|nr:DEAD/DEAH box helicase family protein [Nocardia cyriacigeorgica]NEW32943.1 DEAD/DEAH box helicase family protein [Nocardia cyriacigeorgica]